MPGKRGELGGVTREWTDRSSREPEQPDYSEEQALPYADRARIIDWRALVVAPIAIAIVGLIAVVIAAEMRIQWLGLTVLIFAVIAPPLNLVVNALGVVLDPNANTLTYPVYLFRRHIPLNGIRAANCQNVTQKFDSSSYERMAGGKGGKIHYSKSYHVNLSGDFESRRLIFTSKYKRDQFLTYLRDYVPSCRITRWS